MKKTLKIIKIGGKLIEDELKFTSFLTDFCALNEPKILIHGGGSMATKMMADLGHKTKMVGGRRVTDENGMRVTTMVYGGLINKSLVGKLQANQVNAIGLCGADGKSIISKKRPVKEVDYGFVGDIVHVNAAFIAGLLKQEIVPVFSAISCTEEGILLNTNADSIASEIAKAMSSTFRTELYYCFEKKGVLANASDEDSVIDKIDHKKYRELLKKNIISDGMLPKLQNCFEALGNGVNTVTLGNSELLKSNVQHTKIVS